MFDFGEPLVSVIIPTYNREKIISNSIFSVLNQTYKNFELIIVDDCSTDNTVDVVKKINDPRIVVLRQPQNMGACAARNRGVDESKGSIIAFQDSDDLWNERKLERQISELYKNHADITFCSAQRIMNGSTEFLPEVRGSGFIDKRKLQTKSMVSTQMLVGFSECFKAEKFDERFPRYQDYDLVIRLAEKYKFYYVDEPLVSILVQFDSITNDSKKLITARKLLIEKYADIMADNKDMKCDMFKSLLHNEAKNGISDSSAAINLFNAQKSVKNAMLVIMSILGIYKYTVRDK